MPSSTEQAPAEPSTASTSATTPMAVDDGVTRLVKALKKLNRCREPSELIYQHDSPLPPQEPPHGVSEDYSITVARRIAIIMARLSDLALPASQNTRTPRVVLQELMDIVRHGLFLALPYDMRQGGQDTASLKSFFNVYVSAQRVPIEAMVEGLYTITYVSAKLRVELVTLQLQRRLREELSSVTQDDHLAALMVTDTLLEDFMELYNNVLRTVPAGKDLTPAEAAALLPTIARYYYQLGEWIMLTETANTIPAVSLTRVRRVQIEGRSGVVDVELTRPSPDTPWGLLFNEQGHLVDIDVAMRIGDKPRELHNLLKCSKDGAAIVAVNEAVVGGKRRTATATEVFTAIQAASQGRKRIHLQIRSNSFKSSALFMPKQVAFALPAQGNEGAYGQRASLLLHRTSAEAEWLCDIRDNLLWVAPPVRMLSSEAAEFVRAFPQRLRVLAINGVEVLTAAQGRALMERAETLLLDLVVTPPPLPGAAVSAARSRRGRDTAAKDSAKGALSTLSAEVVEKRVREVTQRRLTEEELAAAVAAVESASAPLVDATAAADVSATVKQAAAAAEVGRGKGKKAASQGKRSTSLTPPPSSPPAAVVTTGLALRGETMDDAVQRVLKEMLQQEQAEQGEAAHSQTASSTTATSPKQESPGVSEDAVDLSVEDVYGKEGGSVQASTPIASQDVLEPTAHSTPPSTGPAPCVFDNDVKLLQLSEEHMVLERPSKSQPWGLPIGRSSDLSAAPNRLPLRLLRLPTTTTAGSGSHPFLQTFAASPDTWYIARVNGKKATDAEATIKYMGKLSKMTLRFLRK